MPVLQSDDPEARIDKSDGQSNAVLAELRERSFTIGWAAAVLVATAGGLYFVARMAWFLISWSLE
jgi:hypothetical protein